MSYAPIRKITNSGSRKNTGFFPSIKNERPVAFESLLERDYMYLLEYDDDVITYKEQPLTISYCLDNRIRRYTPDFSVKRKNKTQLIEIKPQSKLKKILYDDYMLKKYNAAALFCKSNGYSEFNIVTDEEIRSGHLLNNIKYLFSYSKLVVPAFEKLEIRNELMIGGRQQLTQLLSKLCKNDTHSYNYHAYILAMLFNKEIQTNLAEPICLKSYVYVEYTEVN